MRQPFSYYGGKKNMIGELEKLIPDHIQYCEIFAGGASLFWTKKPSINEVLNDTNGFVTNFYMQLKTNFKALQKMIQGSLHSEILYKKSYNIIETGKGSPLNKAWALWYQANVTFSNIIQGGFAFSTNGEGKNLSNKRDAFSEYLSSRLKYTEIFNRDALEIIELKDHPDTFFYVDPPYFSSDQGHYKGYTLEDFTKLLKKLSKIKGKFLLSSYPEEILLKYRDENKWNFKDIQKIVSVTGKRKETKYKTECLTWNYQMPNYQIPLFK